MKKVIIVVFTLLVLVLGINSYAVYKVGNKYDIDVDIKKSIMGSVNDYVTLNKIPKNLKDGVILLEDRRFYSHRGYDIKAIARALIADVKAGKFVQGGSTITQQLAKNIFLTSEKTLKRKITELYISINLEKIFTKDEILEIYFNVIYYGEGIYGVQDASKKYFSKNVWELNEKECIVMAAIPKSPNKNNPIKNPKGLNTKKDNVLALLNNNITFESKYFSNRDFKGLIKSYNFK